MKGVFGVKVDGGFLMFPRDVIVLQEDVAGGKFTEGAYDASAWGNVKEILETPPYILAAVPEAKDDIPF